MEVLKKVVRGGEDIAGKGFNDGGKQESTININSRTNGTLSVDEEDGKNMSTQTDERDAFGNSRGAYGPPTACMPTERHATHYKMDHKRRGKAVIFNHMKFYDKTLSPRRGTSVDCSHLHETLLYLGFVVEIHNDLTLDEIKTVLAKVAHENYKDDDCFLMTVLSHGDKDVLHASDSCYKPQLLFSHFTGDRCPSLAGKPKLFFIQACQGDQLDTGVILSATTEHDGKVIEQYKIPAQADFLIAYSTAPGYYSWRNTEHGSWFIQTLCRQLKNRAFDIDLMSILTYVNQDVAISFESNTPQNKDMHQKKQVPCIVTMLTRFLQFTKK